MGPGANGSKAKERAHIAVARQPILDRDQALIGYELLFRGYGTDSAQVVDDQHATASVIVDGFFDVGFDDLVGEHRAWVNVSRDFLLRVRPLPLPPDRIVLELLENQVVDDQLIEVLAELCEDGFTIALDDFTVGDDDERLLEHASIIKVDVLEHSDAELEELLALLRGRRAGLTLLAEKVESREVFERCSELGFHAFQGYFFAKPSQVTQQRTPSSALSSLSAMASINAAEDFDELHRLIERDAGLSIRLLRYTNSAYFYLPHRIGSIREGLMMLGAVNVRRFALMVALAGARDAPSELLVTALARARMCQLLSGAGEGPEGDSYFTVGLFSVADALIDAPMETVLEELPFKEEIAAALLDGSGELGELLSSVVAYERGDFTAASTLIAAHPDVEDHYREAIMWADQNVGKLV